MKKILAVSAVSLNLVGAGAAGGAAIAASRLHVLSLA